MRGTPLPLSQNSRGVAAYVRRFPPQGGASISAQLAEMTTEELFTRWNTAIFRGKITGIYFIHLDFNGHKDDWAIAEIQVDRVYRGLCQPGDTVTVRLPYGLMPGQWVEDTTMISAMRAGMEGVFMAMPYDEGSLYQTNGASLCLRDVAEYGFPDGVRFVFLETAEGLVFDRHAHPEAAGAGDLDDIGVYIEAMLARVG